MEFEFAVNKDIQSLSIRIQKLKFVSIQKKAI